MLVEQGGDRGVIGNGEAGEPRQGGAAGLERQQAGLVAGDHQVELFGGQQAVHGGQPVRAIPDPEREAVLADDVARGERGGDEVLGGCVHRDALTAQRANDGEKAAGVVAEQQHLAGGGSLIASGTHTRPVARRKPAAKRVM